MKEKLDKFREECRSLNAEKIILWALESFGKEKLLLASSFSIEDQVLTDLLLKAAPNARILTLDTGRMFQETYEVMQASMEKYNIEYEVLFPEAAAVEEMEKKHGPNLMYKSVENRKLCCGIRKIQPLKRALATADAWICGLRKEHSESRGNYDVIEWDEEFDLFKISPILNWKTAKIRDYIKNNKVTYNKLHDNGFTSIGCAPCTRAIYPGEENRSGRWWWEQGIKRECGLHPGKK